MTLTEGSIDLVKGFTKASVIAFVLLSLAECDVNTEWAKIQPFCKFLDRAWLLPIHDTRLIFKKAVFHPWLILYFFLLV